MSARKRETGKRGEAAAERKSSRPVQSEPDRGLYVYCIGEAHELDQLMKEALPASIEDEGGLELIEESGLAAVSSRVALNDYNEDALQANLADAAWTALRAMRHERVVDYFARRASVAPLRFGTIYLERERVLKMLRERGEELRSVIEHLRGREEWGVNVFCDRKALLESIAEFSPRLRELNEQAAKASPGQAYLVRKKMEAMRSDEARAEVRRTVAYIEQELRPYGEGAAALRVLKDEAGELGELVGKLAFLVARERFAEFRGKAERLAQETDGRGFRLELTGPWPAYNFVGSN